MKKKFNKNSRKDSKVILDEIQIRFENGEKLSTKDILAEYFVQSSPLQYLMSRQKVVSLLTIVMKRRFARLGFPFGCVNDQGQYGIPNTEEEVRYAITNYYKFAKGTNVNAQKLVAYAAGVKLLPRSFINERITLPRIANGI